MVQRDEVGAYENAKLSRVADVSDALGYELRASFSPKGDVVPSRAPGQYL